MMERFKNMMLAVLILLSLFLSWQLWTYQPQYDYLPQTEYAELEGLAYKRDWQELLKPHLIIYHLENREIRVAYPSTYAYGKVQSGMKTWELEPLERVEPEQYEAWQARLEQDEGLELYFWEEMSLEVLAGLFGAEPRLWMQNLPQELLKVQRIWLYQDPIFENEVALLFMVSPTKIFQSRVNNLSLRHMDEFITLGKSQPLYEPLATGVGHPHFDQVHYVSQYPITMAAVKFRYQRIPIHHMLTYLFVEPSLVRRIEEKGDTMLYVHGSKGLQVNNRYTQMLYFHPHLETTPTMTSSVEADVGRAIQFVNQHKGWDKEYVVEQVNTSPNRQSVHLKLREHLDAHPVFSREQSHVSATLTIDLELNRVVGYGRSLLQRDMLTKRETRELPAGVEVIKHLEANGFDLSQLARIRPGYKLELNNLELSYEPQWVIDIHGGERWFIQDLSQIGSEMP